MDTQELITITPNIYLDVDGVLLHDGKPASGSSEFLHYVLGHFPNSTYWLTTRCTGNAEETVAQICHLFDQETQTLLKQIKPTSWPIVKTQAIDFSKPFLWFDDQLGFADRQKLIEQQALDNFILVNLNTNPDSLKTFINDFPVLVED